MWKFLSEAGLRLRLHTTGRGRAVLLFGEAFSTCTTKETYATPLRYQRLSTVPKCQQLSCRFTAFSRVGVARPYSTEDAHPIVSTSHGKVQGIVKYAVKCEQPVRAFLGIPYAAPALGDQRFTPPRPHKGWTEMKDATNPGVPSVQDLQATAMGFKPVPVEIDSTSEDCLHLDVYSPCLNPSSKLPVLFWIHGGSLNKGYSGLYDGTAYAALENIVVVIINYRLGALGFLHTGDDVSPGNYGFLDQVAALKWVQENIEQFGGDPGNVTVAGESAGALSAQAMVLSSQTKGLFHRAISQSASAIYQNVVPTDGATRAFKLGAELGCKTENSETLVRFLRAVPVHQLLEAQNRLQLQGLVFTTAIDGQYLVDEPRRLYQDGRFNQVPQVIGCNRVEGFYMSYALFPPFNTDGFNEDQCMQFLLALLKMFYGRHGDQVFDEAMHVYYPDAEAERRKDGIYLKKQCADLVGDMFLIGPTYLSAVHHCKKAKTYFYEYAHAPSYTNHPSWIGGATHAEELLLMWGDPWMHRPVNRIVTYTEAERQLSRAIMKYWANFARTGDPNGGDLPVWPEFTSSRKGHPAYLEIDLDIRQTDSFRPDRMDFWNRYIPDLIAEKD